MRVRNLVAGCMAGVVLLCAGCGKSVAAPEVDDEVKGILQSALDQLMLYDSDYTVSTVLDVPGGGSVYIEVQCKDGNYTEYPVDEDGNLGVVDYENMSDGMNYLLTDWITTDGKMYTMQENEEGNGVFERLPNKYAELCSSRRYLYVDKMMDAFTDIEYQETLTVDIGNGDEEIALYRCKLPSSVVKDILGVGTYGLYSSIREENAGNSSIVKLCDYYLEDYDMNLVFSDALVVLGVSGGMLKYMTMEVGGLGMRLYLTKAVITETVEVRELPDFSGVTSYVFGMQDFADYVSSFGSLDEALAELYPVEEGGVRLDE